MGLKTELRVRNKAYKYGREIALMIQEQHARRSELPLTDSGRLLIKPLPDPNNVTRYTQHGMKPHYKEAWLKGYRSVYPDAKG